MKTRIVFLVVVIVLSGLALENNSAWARERKRSGTYKGKNTGGTWTQRTERNRGYLKRESTWQNELGTGSRVSERTWDKAGGTGTYSSATNTATGKTFSRSGTAARQGSDSLILDGARTTAAGKTIDVDKTFTRTGSGSGTSQSIYTGTEGKTLEVQKTFEKTDDGRIVSGTYTTSTGKTGTFGSDVSRAEGTVTKDQYLTNQDGLTVQRDISTARRGDTITRDTAITGPLGGEHEYSERLTVDEEYEDE